MTVECTVSDIKIYHEFGAGYSITLHVENLGSVEQIDELRKGLKDGKAKMTLNSSTRHRSLDANSYAWLLIDQIAEKTRQPKNDVYRSYVREVGMNSYIVCVKNEALDALRKSWGEKGLGYQTETFGSKLKGCTNVIMYIGSSEYDTAQMSRLIDMIVQDARELGIETLPPGDIGRMMDRWKTTA